LPISMPMVATDRFVLRGIAVLLFCARPVGSLLRGRGGHGRTIPLADIADLSYSYHMWQPTKHIHSAVLDGISFDHIVRTGEQLRRHGKAERFCCLEIDRHFNLSALLDGEVSRFGTLKNFSDIDPHLLA
jgi:hypothetical protein